MEKRLVAWARAVKARRRSRLPVLWIFTDPDRLPDPRAALAGLPRGLCGVVLRPGPSGPPGWGGALAALCRRHDIRLVVAAAPRLAARLRGGLHLRGGRAAGPVLAPRYGAVVTASAHGRADLVRARRRRAAGVFLSPVFATASHPGAAGLGVVRWAALARTAGIPVLALGGITFATVRRLPRHCAGVGVVGAALLGV